MHTASTAGMVQLEEEGYRGSSGDDDVPMGGLFVASHLLSYPPILCSHYSSGAVPFGVYAVVQVSSISSKHEAQALTTQNFNIPIQIQPQVFCVLALIVWAQILVYSQ